MDELLGTQKYIYEVGFCYHAVVPAADVSIAFREPIRGRILRKFRRARI